MAMKPPEVIGRSFEHRRNIQIFPVLRYLLRERFKTAESQRNTGISLIVVPLPHQVIRRRLAGGLQRMSVKGRVVDELARSQSDPLEVTGGSLMWKYQFHLAGQQDQDLFLFMGMRRMGTAPGAQDRRVTGQTCQLPGFTLKNRVRLPPILLIRGQGNGKRMNAAKQRFVQTYCQGRSNRMKVLFHAGSTVLRQARHPGH